LLFAACLQRLFRANVESHNISYLHPGRWPALYYRCQLAEFRCRGPHTGSAIDLGGPLEWIAAADNRDNREWNSPGSCILAFFNALPATPGALVANQEAYPDIAFACFGADGKTLQFATNPPGNGTSLSTVDFAIDPDGTLTAAGTTESSGTTDPSLLAVGSVPQPNPGGSADGFVYKIRPLNQAPQLFYVNPPVLFTGSSLPSQDITMVGANFSEGMSILWNGVPLNVNLTGPLYFRTDVVTFSLTASQLAQLPPGDAQVQLSVPAPGGGESAAVTVRYVNPQPGNVTIDPSVVPAGSGNTKFTVMGTLVSGCTLTWNGLAQPLTPGTFGGFQFTMPASALSITATAAVVVTNPSPGGGADTVQVSITANGLPPQIPTITGPVLAGVGEGGINQTLSVTNAPSDATVVWNGVDRPTTYGLNSTLQFVLSLGDLGQMGSAQVQVRSGGVLGPAVTAYIGVRATNSNVIGDTGRGQAYFISNTAIAAISVPSGSVLRSKDLGAQVISMFKTDDNAYLWVSTADGRIQRVNIDTFAVDMTATVPGGTNPLPVYTLGAVAVAGSSTTIVAAGVDGILRIFDSGVERGFNSAQMIPALSGFMSPVFATPNAVWATIGYATGCLVRLEYDYTGFSSYAESCGNSITGPWALPSPEVKIDAGVTYFQSGVRTQVWYSPLGPLVDLVNRRVVGSYGRIGPEDSTLYNLVVYDLDSDTELLSVPHSGFLPFGILVPYTSSQAMLSAPGILLLIDLQ
jgi:hypothetical protein